jgi:pimeloyl-ACP methyl ester carboxylesterase
MEGTFMKKTDDGIEWFVRQKGSGPHVVLIPSGEGDCDSFIKTQDSLAQDFTVTTFDMPGMSRSPAPASVFDNLSGEKLAQQLASLMRELSIDRATFYGCSSGGVAAISMAVHHPELTRNIIVHEVPLERVPAADNLGKLDDQAIVGACRHLFRNMMVEDAAAWDAMGPEFHARLDGNYPRWVRSYGTMIIRTFTKQELTQRPVQWTVGGLTEAAPFFHNVVIAVEAGLPVGLLPCRHFPQVTIPDILAGHIKEATAKHL